MSDDAESNRGQRVAILGVLVACLVLVSIGALHLAGVLGTTPPPAPPDHRVIHRIPRDRWGAGASGPGEAWFVPLEAVATQPVRSSPDWRMVLWLGADGSVEQLGWDYGSSPETAGAAFLLGRVRFEIQPPQRLGSV